MDLPRLNLEPLLRPFAFYYQRMSFDNQLSFSVYEDSMILNLSMYLDVFFSL
jgi:hypothetical protein